MTSRTYKWYGRHFKEEGLDQGLILPDFPIFDYSQLSYALLSTDEDIELPVEVKKADLIIMNQACDLKNDKVRNITLCRVYALNEYLTIAGLTASKARDLINNLNSNQVLNMALLEKPYPNPYGGAFEDSLLVKFDESVNYPWEMIRQRIEEDTGEMIKLLPPYREALSQNYGIFFMRVGNPKDREKVYLEHYRDFLKAEDQ